MRKIWTVLLKPRAWVAQVLLALLVVAFLSLGFLGYLKPLQAFLDSNALAFTVGEVRFSAYLLLKAVLTVIIAFWLAGIFAEFGETRIKQLTKLKASNRALLTKVFQILVYFIALLITLDVMSIDLTGLAIFSGAVGIGVGFGLQKITSNFMSGLILLFEKSVEEGDLVELDSNTVGFVRQTGARYTLVETFEGREIMIPNEDFITNRVTNWTYSNNQGRIDINIGVSYGSDLDTAYALILEAAQEHPRCSRSPGPECFLVDYGESSVDFTLYFWVDNIIDGRKRPRSDVLFSIWRKFKENKIEIPFPQRDLHIKTPQALTDQETPT
ncbi:mechanosensitive ion channel family protein [Paremcibacter congregatus]|uniref:Mechanosensitive ion channel protein MscS n=1 Tax=Paremcibacter congregatus TaxID=2043170 RepID=A0A2G4YMN4_9PROT|nr:mechanosensitive ion channel domain-containing protein [Paremcibacter congregatus]PHZ83553.1 mechanosensitive ion channel protein MscS [Paremcibacter congregatus]QDE28361.1 mechanosensitive ion channel [Paremcibacter congregatus]